MKLNWNKSFFTNYKNNEDIIIIHRGILHPRCKKYLNEAYLLSILGVECIICGEMLENPVHCQNCTKKCCTKCWEKIIDLFDSKCPYCRSKFLDICK